MLTPRPLFLNKEYFDAYSPLNGNVDERFIKPHILIAQDKNVKPFLGDDLYAKMIDDAPTYAGDYLTLMNDYIKPATMWFTVVHALPHLRLKVYNGSVAQHISEDTQPASQSDIKMLVDNARDNANHYLTLMVEYLCDNQNLFPEYSCAKTTAYAGSNIDFTRGKRY